MVLVFFTSVDSSLVKLLSISSQVRPSVSSQAPQSEKEFPCWWILLWVFICTIFGKFNLIKYLSMTGRLFAAAKLLHLNLCLFGTLPFLVSVVKLRNSIIEFL